jgi:AcrR family transcriptional regulator
MAGVRQFDEREALERALDVFQERGFRATSMLDLAAETGVQRGSLYHAYGGKEEIFVRAFQEYADPFLAGAAESLIRPDKQSALLSFFDFCIQTVVAGSPSRGCLSTRTAIEAVTDSGRAGSAVRTFLDKLETVVHDGMAAIDDGVELQVDLRAAARLIVTTTRGIAVMERVDHPLPELRAIAETLVTSLLGRPCDSGDGRSAREDDR